MNNYKMFSNYMHNELGITKIDIREWIKEAVEEIAGKMCKQEFDKFDAASIVRQTLYSEDLYGSKYVKDQIKKEIVEQMLKKLEVRVKQEAN